MSGGVAGNDYVRGNQGSDTYLYAANNGNDHIDDQSNSTTDIDTLKFTDLNQSDLTFSRVGTGIVIAINTTGQTITLDNQFYSQTENWGIEKVEFANGSSWDLATIKANAWYRGTTGIDSITGSSSVDTFVGGAGNDYLRGNQSSDLYIYSAGHGSDHIDDQSNSTTDIDTLKFSDLNQSDLTFSRIGTGIVISINGTADTVTIDNQFYSQSEKWGIEKVEFANGDIWDFQTIMANAWYRGTSGNYFLTGTSWIETFSGGLGNDYLRGNGGADTYIYMSGQGNDEIDDQSGSTTDIDVIKFTNLNASDITLSRVGSNIIVGVNATGETIKIDYQFYTQSGNWGIERFEFADGQSWDLQTINANAWYRGTSGNDTISGSSWNDTIAGGAGNDTMSGSSGNDTFVFRAGPGQDVVTDFTAGSDVLEFRDGIFADAAAALAAATASGNNTLITIDATNTVLLQNVNPANLHLADFHIV